MQSFSLIPFPAPGIPEIAITGTISRQGNLFALHYSISGNVEEILLPPPAVHPSRRDELWKMTCFEFFLAIQGKPQYWEFNMSPSGDWNVYRMDAYRRIGFGEEMSIQRLPFEMAKGAGTWTVETTVDLTAILRADQAVDVGVTAIIQAKDGNETYWALTHPGAQADFHLREGFILALAGQTLPARQSAPGN